MKTSLLFFFFFPADRKTQTIKDLAKPWAALPLQSSSSERSTPTAPGPGSHQSQSQAHSAHTTLLLDDSPLKAYLQPWNYLCIREYNAELRSADLALLEDAKRRERAQAVDGEGSSSTSSSFSSSSSTEENLGQESREVNGGKRKRPKKEKKESKKMKAASGMEEVGGVGVPMVSFLPPLFFLPPT